MANLLQRRQNLQRANELFNTPFPAIQSLMEQTLKNFYDFPELYSLEKDLNKLTITPRINLVESDKEFKIEAEMPGMGEEDVKVSLSKDSITLRGEKKISRKNEGKRFRTQEIGYGAYEREIALPEDLDIDQAKASFRKGMLWITIPKLEASERQRRELKIEKA